MPRPSMRSRSKSITATATSSAALISSLLLAAVALGAEDDADFVRGLARRGFFDLADEVCERSLRDPSAGAEAKATLHFVRAEIVVQRAEGETDLEKSQKMIEQAIALMGDFAKKNPGHAYEWDAKVQVAYLRGRRAKGLHDAIKTETSPEKASTLKVSALKAYDEAIVELEKLIADLDSQSKLDENSQETPAFFSQMNAEYELAHQLYQKATIYGEGDDDRKKLLERAVKMLEGDFLFDYGNYMFAYEAASLLALCYRENGSAETALKHLKYATSVANQFPGGWNKMGADAKNIVARAHLLTAQTLNQTKRYKDALQAIDDLFKLDPNADRDPDIAPTVLAALLEKAEASASLGDSKKAIDLANRVRAFGGYWDNLGKDFIEKITTSQRGIGAGTVTPDQMVTTVESLYEREKFYEALQSARKLLELTAGDSELRQKYHPVAFFKMGECFALMKRNYEAGYAFEAIARNFPQDKRAPEGISRAAQVMIREYTVSGDEADKVRYLGLLKILADKYKDSPEAKEVPYIQGVEEEEKGNLRQAADRYLQLGADAKAYERALVQAAFCLYRYALSVWAKGDAPSRAAAKTDLGRGEEVARKCLARMTDPKVEAGDANQQKVRADLAYFARHTLALILVHEGVNRPAEALDLVQQIEGEAGQDADRLSKVWGLKIQVFLALKRLPEAVTVLDAMLDKFPKTRRVAEGCRAVAIELDTATEELIKAKTDENKIKENLRSLGKYYNAWLEAGVEGLIRITLADVEAIANNLYLVARRINGLSDSAESFVDLDPLAAQRSNTLLPEPQFWQNAIFALEVIARGKLGNIQEETRQRILLRLARAYAFISDWANAYRGYEELITKAKLRTERDELDPDVVARQPGLLFIYAELGHVLVQLGRAGQKFQYDNALTVFNNLQRITAEQSKPWWMAKYLVIRVLFERGQGNDIETGSAVISILEKGHPDFDKDQFGFRKSFEALRDELKKVVPRKK